VGDHDDGDDAASAGPMALAYPYIRRARSQSASPLIGLVLLLAGYVAVWVAFSLGAALRPGGDRLGRAAGYVLIFWGSLLIVIRLAS
jgi:hypothetical protein